MPITAPHQDFVTIGMHKTPGKAVIKNLASVRDWEQRPGWGLAGASTWFKGLPLSTFDIEITIYGDDLEQAPQWVDWEVIAKLYLGISPGVPVPGPFAPVLSPKAVGVDHPLLKMTPHSVKEVVFTKITQWEQDDEGSWHCTISCLEYKPPKPMLGKPNGSIPAGKKPVPSAQDAVDAEIAAKRAELAKLAGG